MRPDQRGGGLGEQFERTVEAIVVDPGPDMPGVHVVQWIKGGAGRGEARQEPQKPLHFLLILLCHKFS
jgi:hypothetical protein